MQLFGVLVLGRVVGTNRSFAPNSAELRKSHLAVEKSLVDVSCGAAVSPPIQNMLRTRYMLWLKAFGP